MLLVSHNQLNYTVKSIGGGESVWADRPQEEEVKPTETAQDTHLSQDTASWGSKTQPLPRLVGWFPLRSERFAFYLRRGKAARKQKILQLPGQRIKEKSHHNLKRCRGLSTKFTFPS